jgi:O-antigen/teichoic acid export membrane protein
VTSTEPTAPLVEAPPEDLRAKVVGGLAWTLATQGVIQGSRTVVGVVLAHLLSPHDYGLAAMALVFTALAPIFTDLSLGAALIQRATITEEDRSTAFWTTVAASVGVSAIGAAVSPLVADFFSTPEVAPLFAVTSIAFTLSGLSATQVALLSRELQYRSLQIRAMAAALAGSAAGIGLALAGLGPWALVLQLLVAEGVSTVLVWRFCSWRPTFTYSHASLRHLGSFGGKTLGSRIFAWMNLNVDNLLVGRYLGSRALGIYAVAYNVMFAPVTRIALPIQQVLFPAFARLQHDPERLKSAWLRGNRLVAATTAPAFLGMAVVAPDFVPVVLGRRWDDVVPVLQFLSLAGAVLSFQQLNWSVLQATGRPGTLLRFMFVSSVAIVGAFAAGLHWGVVGVAGLYFAARTVLLPIYTHLTGQAVGVSVREFAGSLARVVEASLVMALAVGGLRLLLDNQGVPQGLRLALVIPFGAALYLGYLALRAPELLVEARSLRRRAEPPP